MIVVPSQSVGIRALPDIQGWLDLVTVKRVIVFAVLKLLQDARANPAETRVRQDQDKIIPAQVRLVDIAGIVRGASTGEGLGNKFLSHIREVDAVAHVLRCFDGGDALPPSEIAATLGMARAVATRARWAARDGLGRVQLFRAA